MAETIPTALVIFGATGDLFQKKLALALAELHSDGKLPKFFRVLAFSRRKWSDGQFREFLIQALKEKKSLCSEMAIKEFAEKVFYTEGEFGSLPSYENVGKLLAEFDRESGVCMNKLFYLATPPGFYEIILENISTSGLAIPCAPSRSGSETGWTRILIEKPFGRDLKNAEKLDLMLGSLFSESQIFRIDHYLAKETMRSILAFRFEEGLFESIWNGANVENVNIRLYEAGGVGSRGSLYEGLGALRDVGQNHALQMLALVAMENPNGVSADSVRPARAEVLKHCRLWQGGMEDMEDVATRGQYEGYRGEVGVAEDSLTETYFRLKLEVENSRWRGVPFLLESGKYLPESKAEIVVNFKKNVWVNINGVKRSVVAVKFGLQPREEIVVLFRTESKEESLVLSEAAPVDGRAKIDAYVKVLLDAIRGDQMLFISTDEVKAEWNIVMPVFEVWQKIPLVKYAKGTMPKTLGD